VASVSARVSIQRCAGFGRFPGASADLGAEAFELSKQLLFVLANAGGHVPAGQLDEAGSANVLR
jgi:hypothetical protein